MCLYLLVDFVSLCLCIACYLFDVFAQRREPAREEECAAESRAVAYAQGQSGIDGRYDFRSMTYDDDR